MSDPRTTHRTETPATDPRPARRALILGTVVVILVTMIAIAATRDALGVASDEDALLSSPATSPPPDGAALARFDPAVVDPAIGASMPSLAGVDFDGSPVEVMADGRAKMILFLAHWCPHCQREVPIVQEWVDAGNLPDGVDLISVATAIDANQPNYPPDEWLEREGWTAPVVVDTTDEIADRFGLSAFPFWVMIDGQGRVAGRSAGVFEPARLDVLASALAEGRSPLDPGAG